KKLTARLPADLAEHQVVAALAETLSDPAVISNAVKEHVRRCIERERTGLDPLPALLKTKQQLENEYKAIFGVVGPHGHELRRQRVMRLIPLTGGCRRRTSRSGCHLRSTPAHWRT